MSKKYIIEFTQHKYANKSYLVSCGDGSSTSPSFLFDGGLESWKLLQKVINETSGPIVEGIVKDNMTNNQIGYALTYDEYQLIIVLAKKSVPHPTVSLTNALNTFAATLNGKDNNELFYIQTRLLNHINKYSPEIYDSLSKKYQILFTNTSGALTQLGSGSEWVNKSISQQVAFLFTKEPTVKNPQSSMKTALRAITRPVETLYKGVLKPGVKAIGTGVGATAVVSAGLTTNAAEDLINIGRSSLAKVIDYKDTKGFVLDSDISKKLKEAIKTAANKKREYDDLVSERNSLPGRIQVSSDPNETLKLNKRLDKLTNIISTTKTEAETAAKEAADAQKAYNATPNQDKVNKYRKNEEIRKKYEATARADSKAHLPNNDTSLIDIWDTVRGNTGGKKTIRSSKNSINTTRKQKI